MPAAHEKTPSQAGGPALAPPPIYSKTERSTTTIDYEMKRPLIERLDKSLLDHAVAAGTKDGGPDILDVYKLQALTEIHYYLKVEHDFSAAEVKALMQFQDPLEVAEACWEEHDPEYGFSICDLLDEIHADEMFPLVDPAGHELEQERLIREVKAVLDQNMTDYHNSLLVMDRAEIIHKCGEIAAMQDAHDFMKNSYIFEPGDAEALLKMEDPLRFVADLWPGEASELFDMGSHVGDAIEDAKKTMAEKERAARPGPAPSAEKPSIRVQLREAERTASQRPAQESRSKPDKSR